MLFSLEKSKQYLKRIIYLFLEKKLLLECLHDSELKLTRLWKKNQRRKASITDSEDEQEIKDGWPMIATRIFPLQRQFNFLNKWKAYSPTKRFLAQFELFQEMRQQLTQCFIAHTTLNYIRILVGTYHDLYPLFVNILKSLRFLKI